MDNQTAKFDVAVIGAGIAGTAASLFSARAGLKTARIGFTGETAFASGLIDLLAVHPLAEGKIWDNPWAALKALRKDLPRHPLARIKEEDIRSALAEFAAFLAGQGLVYRSDGDRNTRLPTAMGTIKHSYLIPESMEAGARALKNRTPTLLVDIEGLKGFSGAQIASTLSAHWPGLHTGRISFPGFEALGEAYPERMALSLDVAGGRERLAEVLKPLVKGAGAVGLPPILGLYETGSVLADLGEKLGAEPFEIPALPPSVPGLRLKEAAASGLSAMGVCSFTQQKVTEARMDPGGFALKLGSGDECQEISASAVILCTGRFIGQGLASDRKGVRETVFGLPVSQPATRSDWHRLDFLAPEGHDINQAGLEIDDLFHPLAGDGTPAHPRLFCAGSITARQNWMRAKCGAGLAISTAWRAAAAAKDSL